MNIMEKAAAYKRKQNLEIPKKIKGKSFTNTDHDILFEQMSKIDIYIGGMMLIDMKPLTCWLMGKKRDVWLLPITTLKLSFQII